MNYYVNCNPKATTKKIIICSKTKEDGIKYYTRKVLSSTQKREKINTEVMKQYRYSIYRKKGQKEKRAVIPSTENVLFSEEPQLCGCG